MKEEKKYICYCYYEYQERTDCSCCVLHNEETKSYFERNNLCGYYDPYEQKQDKIIEQIQKSHE